MQRFTNLPTMTGRCPTLLIYKAFSLNLMAMVSDCVVQKEVETWHAASLRCKTNSTLPRSFWLSSRKQKKRSLKY